MLEMLSSLCGKIKFTVIQVTKFQNVGIRVITQSDVWLTVHRNSVWIRKTN